MTCFAKNLLACKQNGFTLIELMIALAIISVLAAIAIPSYQHYLQRARFAEVLALVQPYKMAITLALQEGATKEDLSFGKFGIPPAPKATKNLSQLILDNGILTANCSASLNSANYILKPNQDGTVWQISGTCLKLGLCHE